MTARGSAVTSGSTRPARSGPAPPVRLLHLGLGNFFRAHQAWYTDRARDGSEWGYAAFTGRRADLAADLTAQDGLYTLVTRATDSDHLALVASLAAAHGGADHAAWLGYFARPELAAVTLTVTEAGYVANPAGRLDLTRPAVVADLAALRADRRAAVGTAPARLVAGLAARMAADAGPLALIPCDNLAANGELTSSVVGEFAELVDPALASWLGTQVCVVTTMVDRITPRVTAADVATVRASTGLDDRCPVVTEPFHDWILAGSFPAGRPCWQDAGATFTANILPFEQRKLWLLNGAHSLLAYAGSILGHQTVADAVADDQCVTWLTQWWEVASAHLDAAEPELAAYRIALLDRFANHRMRHRLDQIAIDGSQKLPVRILPVLRAERAAGRLPLAATLILAAWICQLRGLGAQVQDALAGQVLPLATGRLATAVPAVLGWLDQELAADRDLVAAVLTQCQWFTRHAQTGSVDG